MVAPLWEPLCYSQYLAASMSLGSRSSLGLGRSFGGGVKLDLSVRLSPQLVDGWINHCRHVLRVGLRAYQFKEWCASSRHELLEIPSPLNWFQKINWGDARDWATTTASAATVCLGAHWQHKDPSRAGCIWPGCSSLGHFHHVFWECASRPHFAPARPASPFLARFGCGLLGKTHKLSNRSVFGSLSSSPSFGRFNMVKPCLSLLSGSPYLVPVVGCLAISMVTPFCVQHLSH